MITTRNDELIKEYLKKLRWGSTIHKNYKEIKEDNHADFLVKLLEMEIEEKEITRRNRNLKGAGFDIIKTFEDYSFTNIQIPKTINIEELKSTNFINRKENLILYGPVGTGKTHLATAIGVNAIRRGRKVKYFKTATLVNQLSEAKAKGELERYIKQVDKADILIFDEWGYIPFEKEGSQLLFQIVSGCYEKKSIILTTNLEFSKWDGIFYDEKLTSAIIDRLVHHSHLLVHSGPSYRLTNSIMKTQ